MIMLVLCLQNFRMKNLKLKKQVWVSACGEPTHSTTSGLQPLLDLTTLLLIHLLCTQPGQPAMPLVGTDSRAVVFNLSYIWGYTNLGLRQAGQWSQHLQIWAGTGVVQVIATCSQGWQQHQKELESFQHWYQFGAPNHCNFFSGSGR